MLVSPESPGISPTTGRCGDAGVGAAPTVTALGPPRGRGFSITVWAIGAAAALLVGCNPRLKGDGVYLEEPRERGSFVGIHVQDGVSAVVTSGETQTLRVIGDSNVVPHIDTAVVAEPLGLTTIQVLRVSVTEDYDPTIPPRVLVSVPSFVFVRALGDDDGDRIVTVDVTEAATPTFTAEASGSARVTLSGPGGAVISATGAGDALLDATEYVTSAAVVALSGRATAKLRSNGPVTGTAAGDSRVDNLLGTGPCFVTTSGTAQAICNAY
jgi:hypothetical protein